MFCAVAKHRRAEIGVDGENCTLLRDRLLENSGIARVNWFNARRLRKPIG